MRKLFGTDGIRGEFGKYPIDLDTMFKLGKAAGTFFGKKCLIGRDTRESGKAIEESLVRGLVSLGVDVYLLDIITTPGISYLTKKMKMDFGVVISASHNPYQDNGIKFFDKNGLKLDGEAELEIERLFFEDDSGDVLEGGKVYRIRDEKDNYLDFLKSTSSMLGGLKIVLDCANGAAYRIAPRVFSELGAEVVAVNNSPDGKNINENCGAVHPELLGGTVLREKADIGITLDGDADRVILLDEMGRVIDGDIILAIAGTYLKEKNELGNNLVVGTVMSNMGLEKGLAQQGVKLIKTQVGDKYVVEEMLKSGCVLGGEQSGHIIFSNHVGTGDGILSALQILKIMKEKGKTLSELSLVMKKYPQILINVEVKEKKELNEMEGVSLKIKEAEEGLKEEGRVLVRYSGTQNLLRVMVEGKEENIINGYAREIADQIKIEIGA
ncbi:phosphoglucosamine mutase [Candidatus Woesearchaeota archaeon]|nr:phosphoglucosamine mutase [Candidatus Woesearchaeota archaeon]